MIARYSQTYTVWRPSAEKDEYGQKGRTNYAEAGTAQISIIQADKTKFADTPKYKDVDYAGFTPFGTDVRIADKVINDEGVSYFVIDVINQGRQTYLLLNK